MDPSVMDIAGAQPKTPSKYTPIATLKWIGGYQTQRSPFASLDTRYNSRFLGGKPDALIDGENIELTNKLTLQRRPGLSAYGVSSIPSPKFFYNYEQASLAGFVSIVDPTATAYPQANLQLVVDTASSIYNYSPTSAGILLNKTAGSLQTSMETIANTMYLGDGKDLYKYVGTNLLTWSNIFGSGTTPQPPWTFSNVTVITGFTDPLGGNTASYAVFSATNNTAYIRQSVTPNYTPVANNTFTFSVWMKAPTGDTIHLQMSDNNGTLTNISQTLTNTWALYQVTGTASSTGTEIIVSINSPNTTSDEYYIYGAQLEVGGPATPTSITQNQPLGLYLWGIQAPTYAPTFTFTQQFGTTNKPWQPNTSYSQVSVSGSAVTANGNGTATITTSSIPNPSSLVNTYVSTTGFTNAGNNSSPPGYLIKSATSNSITVQNNIAVTETGSNGTVTLLDSVVDSNGNLQVAYTPGTSGGMEPVWNSVVGQPTPDQSILIQSNQSQSNGPTATAYFSTPVTHGNTKLIFVASSNTPSSGTPVEPTISDSSGDVPVYLGTAAYSNIAIFLFYVLSATAGTTNISVTANGGNQATWIGIAEITHQTAVDVNAKNTSRSNANVTFQTGTVTTTNAQDAIVSFALVSIVNINDNGNLTMPLNFQSIVFQPSIIAGGGAWNMGACVQLENATGTFSPTWTINPSQNSNEENMGITAAFKSSVGSLVWYNVGPKGLTSTSALNYQWGYAFVNTYTGHRSNISPFSAVSGNFAGQAVTVSGPGMQTGGTPASGQPGPDPQVTAIELYRNTDGGGFWYQVPITIAGVNGATTTTAITINGAPASPLQLTVNGVTQVYIPNPGSATSPGTWSVVDIVPDTGLNTQIYAPIGFLNSPPPAGLTNLSFSSGRLWGSVGNLLYYATGPDNATLLNILQNGVSPESWDPLNFIPFDAEIVRSVPIGSGLLVFTTQDLWIVPGGNLSQFNPVKIGPGLGLGNYNSLCVDGNQIMIVTRDRQTLIISPGSGMSEIGFAIGDKLETDITPTQAYCVRHIKGSQDNAFYVLTGPKGRPSDNATGWYRLNPNQYGASTSGEQTPIWSPFANVSIGIGAAGSIETQPGVKQMLVGQTGTGVVLYRNINTFTDNGTSYTWFGTIGSIILALPGKMAVAESITTEMVASESTQCNVSVLLDEISGTFETLPSAAPTMTNDPPQLQASSSVLSNRFYLSTGTVPPVCRHIQVKVSSAPNSNTQDELLSLTVRGELLNEQD